MTRTNLSSNQELILAIDMGGMTAKMGFADLKGNILHRFVVDTIPGDKALPHYAEAIKAECARCQIDYDQAIKAIGFGCVGPLDLKKGISLNAGKIGWHNYPILAVANKLFKKPIYLINDARSIIVGEWKKGAGRGLKTFIIYSIGTGVGGGIILNNQLYRGAHNFANEFGHGGNLQSSFTCGCGLKHCIEGLSSARGIQKYFQVYIKEHPGSSLAKLQQQLDHPITIKDASDLIQAKDPDAVTALKFALEPLAASLTMMIFAFDPEAVLIGGGPSALGQPLIDIIKELAKPMLWTWQQEQIPIKLCALGNDAGLIGVIEHTLMMMNPDKQGD